MILQALIAILLEAHPFSRNGYPVSDLKRLHLFRSRFRCVYFPWASSEARLVGIK